MSRLRPLALSSFSEYRFRNLFIQQHSKFVHRSWLLLEDLDTTFTYDGDQYRIVGVYDDERGLEILVRSVEKGAYYRIDHREVARAMGFNNVRNFVTGVELPRVLKKGADVLPEVQPELVEVQEEETETASPEEEVPFDIEE